jgi:hypothetical protein
MLLFILGPKPRRLATILALAILVPVPLRASLGGNVSSVEADRVAVQGSHSVTSFPDYSIHELVVPTGTVVREFVRNDGVVFAVAWQGPFIPNLRQLLGTHFDSFSQAAQVQKAHRPGHGPLLVEVPGLVVESGGHMRAFFGRAYLPALLPAGVYEGGIQ